MTAVVGLVLLLGAIWVLRSVRPREGHPGAAFLQRRGTETLFALLFTAALALGVALIVAGVVDMWPSSAAVPAASG